VNEKDPDGIILEFSGVTSWEIEKCNVRFLESYYGTGPS
jgi:hypothetical protein